LTRTTVALIAGPVVAAGTALWLFAGASSSLTKAQTACHEKVTAAARLPADTRFVDVEKRATGDVIAVRGEASGADHQVVTYTCSVRGAPGGNLDVQLSIDGGR